jgi:hypothetical protein
MAASGYHGAAMKSIRAEAPSFGVCQQNTGDV